MVIFGQFLTVIQKVSYMQTIYQFPMANILSVVRWIFVTLQSILRERVYMNKIIMYYSTATYHGNNRSTGHVFHQPRKERKMTQVSIMHSQMVFTGLLNKNDRYEINQSQELNYFLGILFFYL